jgi:hypothetical protein
LLAWTKPIGEPSRLSTPHKVLGFGHNLLVEVGFDGMWLGPPSGGPLFFVPILPTTARRATVEKARPVKSARLTSRLSRKVVEVPELRFAIAQGGFVVPSARSVGVQEPTIVKRVAAPIVRLVATAYAGCRYRHRWSTLPSKTRRPRRRASSGSSRGSPSGDPDLPEPPLGRYSFASVGRS